MKAGGERHEVRERRCKANKRRDNGRRGNKREERLCQRNESGEGIRMKPAPQHRGEDRGKPPIKHYQIIVTN